MKNKAHCKGYTKQWVECKGYPSTGLQGYCYHHYKGDTTNEP